MAAINWQAVTGTIERGHQVASGRAADSPYPAGSIAMQKPFFQALGLDLTDFFGGTLNVSIAPHTFKLIAPQYTFKHVEWTDLHPPETFSFSACQLKFRDRSYASWIYYPHPETKKTHFQQPDLIEIIAPIISDINYDDRVELIYNPVEITIDRVTQPEV